MMQMLPRETIAEKLLLTADDEFFPQLAHTLRGEKSGRLISELHKRYEKTQNLELLKEMIIANDPLGLQLYLQKSVILYRPVDSGNRHTIAEVTETIGDITDPNLLPILGQLAILETAPDFEDAEFGSLYGALMKAYANCAEKSYEETHAALIGLQETAGENDALQSFCSNVLERIQSSRAERSRHSYTLQETRRLTAKMMEDL